MSRRFAFIYCLLFGLITTSCNRSIDNDRNTLSGKIKIPLRSLELDQTAFTKKAGHLYYEGKRYSGYVVEKFEDGMLKSFSSYFKGKLEGVYQSWYPNGRIRELRIYANNHKEGEHVGWWENGKPKFIYHFKGDVYHGSCNEWYPNGDPFKFFNYTNGQEDGPQQMWREDGKFRANYVVKDGRKYGSIGFKQCNAAAINANVSAKDNSTNTENAGDE
ncbi:membrane-binding protein [Fulvivirgaceae bacterium BMA10]|uniref:Membrane-binding protein n=1 Tax=Splendidivirga corallicola TaxID=3051826 RepID=A0ABT8KX74_9BACT|nr:membrane-binding protein [Fulvivirgaceae bacterium BMA10]